MLTATKDLMLPATVTGSWPRPRWYDGGLWGRPLDTALLDVRFREQFLDAHATVIADQERAGLDILTNGDYHLDEDFAGRSWHHYPLQRLATLYNARGWPVTAKDGAFTAPYSAPSAGPPPWDLYEFTPKTAFGVATAEPHGATRWDFGA